MGCIALVRCVLVLRCGLAGVVWYPYAGWSTWLSLPFIHCPRGNSRIGFTMATVGSPKLTARLGHYKNTRRKAYLNRLANTTGLSPSLRSPDVAPYVAPEAWNTERKEADVWGLCDVERTKLNHACYYGTFTRNMEHKQDRSEAQITGAALLGKRALGIIEHHAEIDRVVTRSNNNNNNNIFNCKWAVTRWQWLLCMYIHIK